MKSGLCCQFVVLAVIFLSYSDVTANDSCALIVSAALTATDVQALRQQAQAQVGTRVTRDRQLFRRTPDKIAIALSRSNNPRGVVTNGATAEGAVSNPSGESSSSTGYSSSQVASDRYELINQYYRSVLQTLGSSARPCVIYSVR